MAQKRAACKSTPTDLDGNTEYADFEVNTRREKHDLKEKIQSGTCVLENTRLQCKPPVRSSKVRSSCKKRTNSGEQPTCQVKSF